MRAPAYLDIHMLIFTATSSVQQKELHCFEELLGLHGGQERPLLTKTAQKLHR
jgi:hypothetical protein